MQDSLLRNMIYIEHQYVRAHRKKKRFAVSTQHYAFAVKAFIQYSQNEVEFKVEYQTAIRETRTN